MGGAERLARAVWRGDGPPLAQILQRLNPQQSPFDCAAHARALRRRVRAHRLVPTVEEQERRDADRAQAVPLRWRRAQLAGETPATETVPEALTPANLREAWGKATQHGALLTEGQLGRLNPGSMVSLIQAQFPQLDEWSARELWAKVSADIALKDKATKQDTIYSDLTLNVTQRDVDETPGDDLTFDMAQLLARVQDHWIVKTHTALEKALDEKDGLTHEQLQRVLARLWEMPEHEARYAVDPYPLYHRLLEELIDPAAAAAEARNSADSLSSSGPGAAAEKAAAAARRAGVAICLGARKRARAAVRLTPAFPAHSLWVDSTKGLSPLTVVFGDAGVPAAPRSGGRKGGVFTVNGAPMTDFFFESRHIEQLLLPFDHAGLDYRNWHVEAKTYGGNHGTQAESIRLATARAIAQLLPETVEGLNSEYLLREDPRRVLPKLSGLRKHKKRRQWRKR